MSIQIVLKFSETKMIKFSNYHEKCFDNLLNFYDNFKPLLAL